MGNKTAYKKKRKGEKREREKKNGFRVAKRKQVHILAYAHARKTKPLLNEIQLAEI